MLSSGTRCWVGVRCADGDEGLWTGGSGLTALESRLMLASPGTEGTGLTVRPGVACGLSEEFGERAARPAFALSDGGLGLIGGSRPGRWDGRDERLSLSAGDWP